MTVVSRTIRAIAPVRSWISGPCIGWPNPEGDVDTRDGDRDSPGQAPTRRTEIDRERGCGGQGEAAKNSALESSTSAPDSPRSRRAAVTEGSRRSWHARRAPREPSSSAKPNSQRPFFSNRRPESGSERSSLKRARSTSAILPMRCQTSSTYLWSTSHSRHPRLTLLPCYPRAQLERISPSRLMSMTNASRWWSLTPTRTRRRNLPRLLSVS